MTERRISQVAVMVEYLASRTEIALTQVPGPGSNELTWTAADTWNQHSIWNNGRVDLLVQNPDVAESITVTVVSADCSHNRESDIVQVVGAASTGLLGPFPRELFNQQDGTVQIDLSGAAAGVTLAAIIGR